MVCSPRTHRGLVGRLGNLTELSAFSLDYRLGPEHPWPCAGNDAIRGYRWLLSQGYRAEDIVIAGDSAGGHLALDILAVNHATRTPQPGSMVLFSPPLYDPTFDLAVDNQRSGVHDPIINAITARKILRLYTRTADPDHPRMRIRLTPPEMTLPKTLIQYGSLEVMGADARATHDEIVGAGGVSVIQAWPDQGARVPADAAVVLGGPAGGGDRGPVHHRHGAHPDRVGELSVDELVTAVVVDDHPFFRDGGVAGV